MNAQEPKKNWLPVFAWLSVTLGIIFTTFIFNFGPWCKISDKGTFGDYFNGTLGPFLSLASILLLYTAYRLQKKELEATTKALANQYEQMKVQLIQTRLDRLENICFKLLELYLRRVPTISSFDALSNYKYNGEEAIKNVLRITALDALGIEFINQVLSDKDKKEAFDKFAKAIKAKAHSYNDLKNLTYKFIAIYKCIQNSEKELEAYENLTAFFENIRFALNTQITRQEEVMIKTIVLSEDDLQPLIPFLEKFRIHCSEVSIINGLKEL